MSLYKTGTIPEDVNPCKTETIPEDVINLYKTETIPEDHMKLYMNGNNSRIRYGPVLERKQF
jgi:hypothetical protein